MKRNRWILPVIVLAQFFCTSLWFAGNAVIDDLIDSLNLNANAAGDFASFVQIGFIIGTLFYALLTISDRFSPSKVFLVSAFAGALANLGMVINGIQLPVILGFRCLTGFFLAGIYPVGMKIASDYYSKGLGKSLGFLVGALVLGTAFPHLLKCYDFGFSWKLVLFFTSSLAVAGGIMMYVLVPDGPYRRQSLKIDFLATIKVFQNKTLRKAAFGYFGHMWELYAFWTFVPILLGLFQMNHPSSVMNIPLLSFMIIGVGSVSCVVGGYLAEHYGIRNVAYTSLFLSGVCCIASPIVLSQDSLTLLILFLVFWGMVVIADSPMFSALVAQSAESETKGTALTVVTCIGFAVSIISIQLINAFSSAIDPNFVYLILVVGPLIGLLSGRNHYI